MTIMPGKDGLVHISQITDERVENVGDYLREGDVVKVKVLDIDSSGRIRLSIKAVAEDAAKENARSSFESEPESADETVSHDDDTAHEAEEQERVTPDPYAQAAGTQRNE